MALTVRRRGDNGLNAWPGYVDALSTLLMVLIFVLLVFVLAQGFLSVALTGRNQQLDRVNRQLAEVSDMLSLERGRSSDLQQSIGRLNRELAATGAARDTLSQQLADLREQAARVGTDRDTLRAERDRLSQQLVDAGLQSQSSAARLAEMQKQLAELDKTVKADKETIDARLADLAKLAEQNRALTALRDELEKQTQDAAARAMTDQQRRAAVEAQLSGEKRLGDSARC
jgi:chemotaxis protein MotB